MAQEYYSFMLNRFFETLVILLIARWRMCSIRTWTQVCGAGIARSWAVLQQSRHHNLGINSTSGYPASDTGGAAATRSKYQYLVQVRGGDCLCCDHA